jgi:hypothetical protein
MEGERPLHADAVRHPAHSETLPCATASACYHRALKCLQPLTPTFDNFDIHPHSITRAKVWNILLEELFFHRFQNASVHRYILLIAKYFTARR